MRALDLLREVQAAGAFGMRVEEDKVKGATAVVFFQRDDVPAKIAEKAAEIRRLLKLAAEPQKFVLTYSPMHGEENELAVNSRSMLQIMQAFASYVEVPEAHVTEGRAVPSPLVSAAEPSTALVRTSDAEPGDAAFVTIHYRDRWFWIDDRDLRAKRDFAYIMLLFTLANTGSETGLPVITIPAQ